MNRNRIELLLILTLFATIITSSPIFHQSAAENSFTFVIHGPAQVYLVYPNGTEIPVSNGTYYFTGIMGVYVQAPQGYNLYVNGEKIPLYYLRFFNTSETFIIYAIPVYDTLTINLEGNGYVVLHFQNGTEVELTTSASFKVLNTTFVYITSTTPFMVDRNTMVTHYFGENITSNTTWNVIFNPPTPKGYVNITVILYNQGTVNMIVYNSTLYPFLITILTNVTLNHTESFLVPKGYRIAFYSYTYNFTVNDKPAVYMLKDGYYLGYFGTAKYNSTIIIVFYKAKTTHAVQTSTSISTSTTSHSTAQTRIAYVAIGIALVATAVYIAIKFRSKS